MPITLNGTTGVVTPGATVGSITGVLKATSGVVSQAVAGSDYGQLTLATAQTASGTAVDFTGIPSWVKRITVMMNGVSTNGSSVVQLQIGTSSSGFVVSGYSGAASGTLSGSVSLITNPTTGCQLFPDGSSAYTRHGQILIVNITGNTWTMNYVGGDSTTARIATSSCTLTLTSTLDRIRITTVNGTDTFDAGTINISYE